MKENMNNKKIKKIKKKLNIRCKPLLPEKPPRKPFLLHVAFDLMIVPSSRNSGIPSVRASNLFRG